MMNPHPLLPGQRDVLDQAAQGQFAGRGLPCGLLAGRAAGGVAQEVTLPGQGLKQAGTMSHAFARTPARPVSHVAFALSLMTMAAISPPRLPAALSLPGGPDPPGLSTSRTGSR
jgi:hypothetical protein